MELLKDYNKDKLEKLFDNFYQYEGKVIQVRNYNNQVIEVPDGDPDTFKKVSGFFMDKNHVYRENLTKDSPSRTIKNKYGNSINNPEAKWEINIIDGIDPNTFKYIKEKYDTVYWKDKNGIYVKKDGTLKKLEHGDLGSFEYIGFLYGRDKNHIYYENEVIPIDVHNYSLDTWGFIKDHQRIFHYDFEIGLDPETFEVEHYNLIKQPIILRDKTGKYAYTRSTQSDAGIVKME
jgi:hypothetical protein